MSAGGHEVYSTEISLQGSDRSDSVQYETLKYAFDTILATGLLVVLSPVILISLILVRLTSRGPLIYTQERLGLNGKPFTILKIRTMYPDSELDGPTWSRPGDPRSRRSVDFFAGATPTSFPNCLTSSEGK